ncbi:MAG: hypothetical protein BWY74_04222 [Firmicutes bacterium ADurb.Bin419]|nr:MAG: hypothetical protein BWY74_04222 [Firmicutes bacterium ADurb.Bin419]
MMGLIYRINKAVLYKISVMLVFAGFFLAASFNGKAKLYIHPKLIPMLVMCAFVFIAISFVLLKDLFKDGRKAKINFSMLIFIPPLIMALIIPAKPVTNNFSAYNSANQSLQGSSGNSADNGKQIQQQVDQTSNPEDTSGDAYEDGSDSETEVQQFQMKDNKIVIRDNNYLKWMEEICNNISKYEGKEIELIGFVFKDSNFKEDEFVAARSVMACCAADTQVVGFMCKYNEASSLKKNSWYKYSGKIISYTYQDKPMPAIEIENMISVAKPKDEYLYPY